MNERFPRRAWWGGLATVLAVALLGRALLLASGVVSFHSDEAVVALMARHILQGERPVFFYGQAYMGSLDPWLVAAGFALLGESVQSIRLVQSALYLSVVAASYGAAVALSGRVRVAVIAGLTLAVPNVLVALYTTATLGGYNETLLLGALLVWIGFPIQRGGAGLWRWALVGLLAGLGWWTNALIAVYLLPLGVLLLVRLWRARADGPRLLIGPALALAGFALGSAPWWSFALEHDLAPLRFLIGDRSQAFAGADAAQPFDVRLFGLLAFGWPSALGLRFPWSPEWFLPAVAVLTLLVYGAALARLARRGDLLCPGGREFVLGQIGLLSAVFLLSRFSNDPTGRYFLPLTLPLGVALGTLARMDSPVSPRADDVTAPTRAGLWPAFVIGGVVLALIYPAAGVVAAAREPLGLTTQFNTAEHIPAGYDAALLDFLRGQAITTGYTSYWGAFRLTFLSGETVTFSAALPPRNDLDWTPFYERYPPYRAAADAAPPVFLTANTPALDAELQRMLAAAGVIYALEQIGPYRVYYAFDRPEAVPRPPFTFARRN